MEKFPHYFQENEEDNELICLKIIAKYYGRNLDLKTFQQKGVSNKNINFISSVAESIGFRTLKAEVTIDKLKELNLPCILPFEDDRLVVLYGIKTIENITRYFISDPVRGIITFSSEEFLKSWVKSPLKKDGKGVVLALEVTPEFNKNNKGDSEINGIIRVTTYLFRYKKLIVQLFLGLIAASLLQFTLPFLTQSIVDVGIQNFDLNFIYIILFAQISLFAGRTTIEIIRGWILLHIGKRVNISLISDFFLKLMSLPIAHFDTKTVGDVFQRLEDHEKLDNLITASSLNMIFSVFNLLVFGIVLAYYNLSIFSVFLFGSGLYFVWILIFLKRREVLNHRGFEVYSKETTKIVELTNGMQSIKLHNVEKQKRWEWEYIKAQMFDISVEDLKLSQYQDMGASGINELKNIVITFLAAKLVISGSISLGTMLSITYIVGQLNTPMAGLVEFIRDLQDAKISLGRINEIYKEKSENTKVLPQCGSEKLWASILVENVSFKYSGNEKKTLDQLCFEIPLNKTTAIVGESGSGKTTLMKLLLKFYEPSEGKIAVGKNALSRISQNDWRNTIGTVMQEGFIFNDTIANNVALGADKIDIENLKKSLYIADIDSFVESLPDSYNTQIGEEGLSLSTGQTQRILIARAVYKNPQFLFFDEATSALDTRTEKNITERLQTFVEDKTMLVIAHRLNTVKNADQILVLGNGRILESGNHETLANKKGFYYELVKNQLELGN